MNLTQKVKELAKNLQTDLVVTRRHLHSNPELSFKEFKTTEYLVDRLKSFGYDLERITETGGYIDIKGKNIFIPIFLSKQLSFFYQKY